MLWGILDMRVEEYSIPVFDLRILIPNNAEAYLFY